MIVHGVTVSYGEREPPDGLRADVVMHSSELKKHFSDSPAIYDG